MKQKIEEKGNKLAFGIATGVSTVLATVNPVFATGGAVTINSTPGDIDTVAGGIVGVILQIFFYIGIILGIWGVGQLVLAFRNDDADSKTRAVMLIVAAVALIGLRSLLNLAGFIQ